MSPDELAAGGQNRRTPDYACPLFVVVVVVISGEPPDLAAVWRHSGTDR